MNVYQTQYPSRDNPCSKVLFHYFCCEVGAKLLQGAKDGVAPHEALQPGKVVDRNKLKSAITYYNIKLNKGVIDKIFSTDDVAANRMSTRMLRNKIVHEMANIHINASVNRSKILLIDMQDFMDEINNWANQLR